MTNILEQVLTLEQIGTHVYASTTHLKSFRNSIFGGQVIGQAIIAAQQSCPDKTLHSLHGYFLNAATNESQLEYHVSVRRHGRSLDCIDVQAMQDSKSAFSMTASFHRKESGFEHQESSEPLPTHLLDDTIPLVADEHIKADPHLIDAISPFALKACQGDIFSREKHESSQTSYWLKPRINIKNNAIMQAATLGFASDFGMLASALLTQPTTLFSKDIFAASLDHSLWIHNIDALDFNQWLLYKINSPWAGNGRGFAKGKFYTPDGRLIASTAQEGLIRSAKH